jgi:hypothetical protein
MISDPGNRTIRPAEVLREQLAIQRKAGLSFRLAWDLALREAMRVAQTDRADWVEVFRWARPEFEAAYNGQPTPAAEVIAALDGPRPWAEVEVERAAGRAVQAA